MLTTDKYWAERTQRTQKALTDKSIAQTERKLRKYYRTTIKQVIADFEATYDKLLATVGEGKQPTPADLYKLDKYWEMQGQLKVQLEKLGDKEVKTLSNSFVKHYQSIYDSIAFKGSQAFHTVDEKMAYQMINQIWCADGKSWSSRIWDSKQRLSATLNEELVKCVITGKKTSDLNKMLMERFNVDYYCAKRLTVTEMAHIQTQASAQKYQDYGLKYYEFLADTDSRTCKGGTHSCASLDGKKFLFAEMVVGKNAPPMHPNCRCSILPVIE